MTAASPRERRVAVPGGTVWTGTHGSGPGTPLLVLHGGPGMPSHYLAGLAGLGDERPVVLYDQLGCGRSDRPADPSLWTLERAVAELDAVRRALDLDEVHLLGHSWGGFLALAYAAGRPRGLRSLVLSSPLVSVPGWLQHAQRLVATLSEPARRAIELHERRGSYDAPEYLAATDEFNRRYLCRLDPWPPELARTFEEMGTDPYRTMWGPSEFTQSGNLHGRDLTETLARLAVPSLWLAGTDDELSEADLRRYAALAGGEAQLFPGGSHCVHLEQPEAYLAAVRRFLRG